MIFFHENRMKGIFVYALEFKLTLDIMQNISIFNVQKFEI